MAARAVSEIAGPSEYPSFPKQPAWTGMRAVSETRATPQGPCFPKQPAWTRARAVSETSERKTRQAVRKPHRIEIRAARRKPGFIPPRSLRKRPSCLKSEARFPVGAVWHPAFAQVGGPPVRPRDFRAGKIKHEGRSRSERGVQNAVSTRGGGHVCLGAVFGQPRGRLSEN
jgi:hypothetical protein